MALALADVLGLEQAGGLDVRAAAAARSWFDEAGEASLGDLDYSAVIAHVRGLEASLPGEGRGAR